MSPADGVRRSESEVQSQGQRRQQRGDANGDDRGGAGAALCTRLRSDALQHLALELCLRLVEIFRRQGAVLHLLFQLFQPGAVHGSVDVEALGPARTPPAPEQGRQQERERHRDQEDHDCPERDDGNRAHFPRENAGVGSTARCVTVATLDVFRDTLF